MDSRPGSPRRWLPPEGSWRYHLLLATAGMLVLEPLAGITAGYGAAGRHGANYIQTGAASVASMGGMAVLLQAMVWMGLPAPPAWQMALYLGCIGMFGVGVGMLCTPMLVDRMRLPFPSGLAVANILRALTDPVLLRRSVRLLGGGIATGLAAGLGAARLPLLGALEFSASTFGAGLVVGARIGIPAAIGGLIGVALQPWFVSIGWLQPGDPPRRIMYLLALGAIMGAAVVDLALVFAQALPRARRQAADDDDAPRPAAGDWRRIDATRLVLWVVFWAAATMACGHWLLGQPVFFLAIAVALVFVFSLVNGISVGVSDSNPISSAFVVTVVILAALGLREAGVGLMAGAVLLVATSVACDMQQDRSTGRRLGTPRVVQFRYQVLGIVIGAVLAVVFARLFMAAYPVLLQDQTLLKAGQQPAEWSSAMTYKFVGVLRSLTEPEPHQRTAIGVGIAFGLVLALLRKWLRPRSFVLDAVVLPSPYALSFGGFVNLPSALWLGAGGVAGTLWASRAPRRRDVPEDMSSASLFGGGLIAGDALAAVGIGVASLLAVLT
ncbi:OPT/YSL family transporter [Variovorax sp. KK3]|uniref:OPT/YSL family transporter n=1 Tax=Variovorax sp. KK3 TaxID=1855728 RepID=UPI00097C7919|nr:OPT/YSL family transporter [Variovorax sp. KK3]